MRFLIFFTIFCAVLVGLHYFPYVRATKGLALSPDARQVVRVFMITSGAAMLFGSLFFRQVGSFMLYTYGSLWLGVIAITFSAFVVREPLARLWMVQDHRLTVIALVVAGGISLYSMLNVAVGPTVRHFDIPVNSLPVERTGMRILQISDLHLTRFTTIKMMKKLTALVENEKPDLIVVTGDLIDDHYENLKTVIDPLRRIRAPLGVYAVTGNHEYYAGTEYFDRILESLGWKRLANSKDTVGDFLTIAGIDDREARTWTDWDDAVKKTGIASAGGPTLLLSHRPEVFEAAVKAGVDLTVAGHTHAGQIPPMDLLVRLFLEFPYGLYEDKGHYLYTTCGTGTWGTPMRFLTRNELPVYRLVPAP